ncbi:uncharacterized protein LOC108964007 [Serinus canaria]|uniref:uncharacterized protein LOC108964007 n=1 Tax=Serinus canaria TaxID=9135 RepID=UPI0021CC7F86|nr:uncharacterized protein LOC108964007 [Serinus canaria]XP_050830687.1 uncharacterized protein LOC108964007 [Serinus canaria]XP_050830688.1 uncharacterized protein LOC108964007 [Serinus canaria]XP_050830689.1 uncharacterized protein LOC108964007 [Serinus canaria]XP_050830690.1 uncharacterized protein LOC108964007 [Serinus canaria]XP_050830691.1 uncharacterized protein LOC108964007 [Serinus canaria]XP_050830692.1 uncharacterized protein LOC108964007 [Serinus canaria]XP_050830693.1 uncharacte
MGSHVSTKEKAQVSAEEKAVVKAWTIMLGRRGIKYDKKALCTFLQWCRNHGVDVTIEAAFIVKNWERAGELILESASGGDETAKNIMTTWSLVLDTLKLLKLEQNAKTAAEARQAPPAKTPSDSGAHEGAPGGGGATSSFRVERTGKKLEGKQLSSAPTISATPPAPCAPAPQRPAPPVTTKPLSPPLPMDDQSDDKLLPVAPSVLDRPSHKLGMERAARSRAALGAESSSRELPAAGAAGRRIPSCPQPKPERPKEPPLLVGLWDPNRGDPNCCPTAGPQEDLFTMQPVSATISGYDRVRCHCGKLKALASGDLELTEQLSVPMPGLFLGGQETVSGTTGATIAAYNPVRFWQFMKLMALTSGDYEAAERISVPTFPMSSDDQGLQNNWTVSYLQVIFNVLSQLRQLATQHGLGSPVVTRMLRLLAEYEMTPFDIKQIAGLLCTPMEYMVFESTWQRYVEKQGLRNLAVLQQDPCFGAGVPQLLGLPSINNPQLQARLNPLILAQAKDLGIQALMEVGKMALVTPTQSCAKIKQGPKEPYRQFIERLKDAMEKQIANDEAKNLLIRALARSNANEDCKKAIDLLPRRNPSLDEMIDACAEVGTVSYEMTLLVSSLAAALLPKCYGCGQLGHMKANCPRRYQSWGTHQRQRAMPLVGSCYRCGKPGHFAKQCWSKFHANGQPLSGQGNRNKSAKGKCFQT